MLLFYYELLLLVSGKAIEQREKRSVQVSEVLSKDVYAVLMRVTVEILRVWPYGYAAGTTHLTSKT